MVEETVLTTKEKRKLKKERRKLEKQMLNKEIADIHLHHSNGQKPLHFQAVQNLVLSVFGLNEKEPPWCSLKNKECISKIVLLFLPGLDPFTFYSNSHLFPSFKQIYKNKPLITKVNQSHPLEVLGLSHILMTVEKKVEPILEPEIAARASLPNVPPKIVTIEREKSKVDNSETSNSLLEASWPFPPSHYLLSGVQLREEGFPLADSQGKLPEGFVMTGEVPEAENREAILAVDCEMCRTKEGLELTRATLIDQTGKVLYDSLVVPTNPIIDYLTRFSGISRESLEGITTTLEQVQTSLLSLIPSSSILVGHSLANDLRALKMVHLKVLDTAVLYPHPKGKPYSLGLRALALRFLGRSIQSQASREGSRVQGHDSREDARAALDLALLKLSRGPSFGLWTCGRVSEGQFLGEKLRGHGVNSALFDSLEGLHASGGKTDSEFLCLSDEEISSRIQKQVNSGKERFMWGRLQGLSSFQEASAREETSYRASLACLSAMMTWKRRKSHGTGSEGPAVPPKEEMAQVLRREDEIVGQVFKSLPNNSLLLVATGCGDVHLLKRMKEEQWQFKSPESTPLSELTSTFEKAVRYGLLFACVKKSSPNKV